MNRALLWLVGGVVVLALAVLAIAPELLADLETAGSAVGIALAAVVPATMVAVLFVSTRRRRDRSDRRDRASDDDRHPDRSDLGG
jgi:membrane protein implicated in regulation of membrane protease activity